MAHYESRHGLVSKSQAELYMTFVDLSNFTRMLPEQYKDAIKADYDTLTASAQGFTIAVAVDERRPYDRIRIISTNSPVEFAVVAHFDASATPYKTDFWIELDANLNLVMKAMLGGKIREALDKVVQGLEDVSNGKMPEGVPVDFNPENFK